jgi:hypothetical protein
MDTNAPPESNSIVITSSTRLLCLKNELSHVSIYLSQASKGFDYHNDNNNDSSTLEELADLMKTDQQPIKRDTARW